MRGFQAGGIVTINGRPAGDVVVSFEVAVAGAAKAEAPPAVRTDKLERFVQDGFKDGTRYAAAPSAAGVAFRPDRAPVTNSGAELRFEGSAQSFSARGVVRAPAPLLPRNAKPPGISAVQMTFMRVAGRADLPLPPPHDRHQRQLAAGRLPGR